MNKRTVDLQHLRREQLTPFATAYQADSLLSVLQLAHHAAMVISKKPPETPADDDSLTAVQSKRARGKHLSDQRQNPTQKERTEDGVIGHTMAWLLFSYNEANYYRAVSWIDDELQVHLWVTIFLNEDAFLLGADWFPVTTLEEIAAGQPRVIILEQKEAHMMGILLDYSTHLPLNPVLEHLSVASAERYTYNGGHGRRLFSRQVRLSLRGPLPARLDLGCWGAFAVRRFVPETVRCHRCQEYGHLQQHVPDRRSCVGRAVESTQDRTAFVA